MSSDRERRDLAACLGAPTTPDLIGFERAQRCTLCGDKVRDDVTEHAFFGFKAGCNRFRAAAAMAPAAPNKG